MKIARIAVAAITAVLALSACKNREETPAPTVQTADFTVALNPNTVDVDYAEVVVRHNGDKDVTWYGFLTDDVNADQQSLIDAKVSSIVKKDLHVGKAQTVALRELEELKNYRYIAFAVNADLEPFGTPGSITFSTSPDLKVIFAAEATEVKTNAASFAISHAGKEELTYTAFVTEDLTSEVDELVAADYASKVQDGKLKEGVELLHGNSITANVTDLIHATKYRYIVYGIWVDDSAAVCYGTPADCAFATPLDPALVKFSAAMSGILMDSANASVSYDVKVDDLTWYGFLTEDLTSPAATLIAAAVQGLPAESWQTGAKDVALTGLSAETDYRYIVTGIGADGIYGTPADVKFSTLSAAYVNTVFTVVASDIASHSVKLTITHTGEAEFQYCGFFTEDLESPVASIALPENADQNLMSGLEKEIVIEDLAPNTEYRYVVVGRVNGSDYGTRGEVKFTTADNAVPMAYEDYIGDWKLNGQMFSITAKENGVSYNVDGLPGSASVRCGTSIVEALYDSQKGCLYVMDQDLAQYDDPSTNNYGPLKDFYAGAAWDATDEEFWPVYPYSTSTKSRIFNFVGLDDGTYCLRSASDNYGAVMFGWVILTGSYAGRGNIYSSSLIEFPAIVTKSDKVHASYEDFLGSWVFGEAVLTISKKVEGSTYSVTGFNGQASIYGNSKEVIMNYDAAKHEVYLLEQKMGFFDTADVEAFGSNQYGICDDFLSGYFPYSNTGYFAYPFNTNDPSRLFTVYINTSGAGVVLKGSCSYGTFSHLDFLWVIRSGENAGKGNNYSNPDHGMEIPETMQKASGSTSVSSYGQSSRPLVLRAEKMDHTAPSVLSSVVK